MRDVLGRQSEAVACNALQAQKDKADMIKRLELLEMHGQGGSRSRPQQATAGFSTWIVLLIAVLSFLVGKYLAVSRSAASTSAKCVALWSTCYEHSHPARRSCTGQWPGFGIGSLSEHCCMTDAIAGAAQLGKAPRSIRQHAVIPLTW